VHEALRHETRGIYLIPLLGAAAVAEDNFPSRRAEATIALAGPLTGAVLAAGTGLLYFATRNGAFAAAAGWMALINLFNLLPVVPLDGGRVVKPLGLLDYLYDRHQAMRAGRPARRKAGRHARVAEAGTTPPVLGSWDEPVRRGLPDSKHGSEDDARQTAPRVAAGKPPLSPRACPGCFRLLRGTGDTAVAVHAGDGQPARSRGRDARPARLTPVLGLAADVSGGTICTRCRALMRDRAALLGWPAQPLARKWFRLYLSVPGPGRPIRIASATSLRSLFS